MKIVFFHLLSKERLDHYFTHLVMQCIHSKKKKKPLAVGALGLEVDCDDADSDSDSDSAFGSAEDDL